MIAKEFDIAVIGGGMSGICAAIAAARGGARVALVQDRPVLGGNASSEIRMHICGASRGGGRKEDRETGILEEILLEHKKHNQYNSYAIFDMILWSKVKDEPNITLFLNTHVKKVNMISDNKIESVFAVQLTTEQDITIKAKLFVDTTGDATIAALSGAEYMLGQEAKSTFNEMYAPDEADDYTMGNSLMFKTVDRGEKVEFVKPKWANTYNEEYLKLRGHKEITSGYWWIELGGKKHRVIEDAEEIRDDLVKAVYGVWDHLKNGGDHGADNLDLEWVGFLPGKRESRRVIGDYILVESDCVNGRIFEDAIAYGGWSLDIHVIDGFRKNDSPPNINIHLKDNYTIPYRCIYSKNIENLFIGGRAISASHVAFSSTRVMGTCSVIGQAIGTAAAMCIEERVMPREFTDIKRLQQQLLRDDCYLPHYKNIDEADHARTAKIYCSSELEGFEGGNVINGVARPFKGNSNKWQSESLVNNPQWLEVQFNETKLIQNIQLKLDSNLAKEVTISLSDKMLAKQEKSVSSTLLKDFKVSCYNNDELIYAWKVKGNYQRLINLKLPEKAECTKVKIDCYATNGSDTASIFEVRVY